MLCPLIFMAKDNRNKDLFFRIAGLLGVGVIGALLMGCGLALAFGSYRLSMIFFFIVLGMLACAQLVTRFLK